VLPGNEMPVPDVLVADDAFLLTINLMKSYAGESTKGSLKTVFDYKLNKACHIVENSLGLSASVFRIFRKPLNVKPSTAEDITLACIYLHYFLSRNSTTKQLHSPPGTPNFLKTLTMVQ